ncbi:hypothetical protein [uncultured Aliiroseovarius sp.]|uniref:NYN domain-containing protein n=1 Tax=uncultured Aliiroseovarius sp. TaxID=1658783 RepID=UPI0026108037|nr:hypothetical protein [uncultured Aliiroseovarius sp.]
MQKLFLTIYYVATVFSGLFTLATFLFADWADYLIISAPVFAASLFALLRTLQSKDGRAKRTSPRAKRQVKPRVVVDGSNVMYWKDNTPSPKPLRDVVEHLTQLGYAPRFFFDANAGYLLLGKYIGEREFEQRLGLPKNSVIVVPKGTIADEAILRAARSYSCQIVTNDRYRDWAERYPEVSKPGYLRQGKYRSDELVLKLDPVPA